MVERLRASGKLNKRRRLKAEECVVTRSRGRGAGQVRRQGGMWGVCGKGSEFCDVPLWCEAEG